MKPVQILFKKIDKDAQMPVYANPGDAGADLYSIEAHQIPPGHRHKVRTGVIVEVPDGYVGLLVPRSGNAFTYGVTLMNSPGIIDSGYRGEVVCIVHNSDPYATFHLDKGDRIAQLVVVPYMATYFFEAEYLSESERGSDGLGSSGR